MKVLDIDMDYFMRAVAHFVDESTMERLSESEYEEYVWSESEVRDFFENNL